MTDTSRIPQSRAEQSRAEQSRAEQSRALYFRAWIIVVKNYHSRQAECFTEKHSV